MKEFPLWKMEIQWENGLSGFGRSERIFFVKRHEFQARKSKKSVRICQIRSIRSPIVSPFSKAETAVIHKKMV
jgi:hypothetical protein